MPDGAAADQEERGSRWCHGIGAGGRPAAVVQLEKGDVVAFQQGADGKEVVITGMDADDRDGFAELLLIEPLAGGEYFDAVGAAAVPKEETGVRV